MKDSKTLRVGTLNVRTLTGKIGAVAALATEAGVNVLAMQETRLSSDAARSSSSAFRAAGWTLHQGPQGRDGRGSTGKWRCRRLWLTKWGGRASGHSSC